MSHTRRALVLVAIAGVSLIGHTALPSHARSSTPGPADFQLPPGVSYDGLAFTNLAVPQGGRADLSLSRARLEPGSSIELPADTAATSYLIFVESGTLTYNVDATAEISRAVDGTPTAGTMQPVTTEEAAPLTDVTLHPGDAALFVTTPNGKPGSARNDGQDLVSTIEVQIAPPGAS